MLIRFAAANHRSIKGPIELSLVAVDEERSAVRHFERLPAGLLTLAAIYGPNASGKSNILDALGWVSSAVRDSLRAWEDSIPREPFRFENYAALPSMYEIDFLVNGVRHVYSLHLNDEAVTFEELLSYPERRPRQLFVREGQDLRLRRGLAGGAALHELLTETTLVLSLARRFDIGELREPAKYVSDISTPFLSQKLGQRQSSTLPGMQQQMNATRRLFIDAYRSTTSAGELLPSSGRIFSVEDLNVARSLMRLADLGIDDVEVVEEFEAGGEGAVRLDVRLVHRSENEFASFQIHEESDGTQMWFRLIGPVLGALRLGVPLVLDEIDSSLHPLLSAKLLELFRDPSLNDKNAQLIFTTHDTTLLGELNRDEIWLTEKGRDGATTLTVLAEFGGERVRKSVNLERAYLQGRFGALPRIRSTTLKSIMASDSEGVSVQIDHGRSKLSQRKLPSTVTDGQDGDA